MEVDYNYNFDHDLINVSMGTLTIIDHTDYPNTLNAKKVYTRSDKVIQNVILASRNAEQ